MDGAGCPRLLICPTGIFTRLPVHAAGSIHPSHATGCLDFCVPSFTPTLGHVAKDLSSAPRRICKRDLRALLAAIPQSDFHRRPNLPYALEEIRTVKSVLTSSAICTTEISNASDPCLRGTAKNVVQLLPSHSILHLACHGHQDLFQPLDSGFVMQDGMLTVSELLALNLPDPFMVLLSACETAKGDRNLPDQAIHLAATMLFAGFKSVVGTMW